MRFAYGFGGLDANTERIIKRVEQAHQDRIIELEQVLDWYAQEENYDEVVLPCDCRSDYCGGLSYHGKPVLRDRGTRARKALGR